MADSHPLPELAIPMGDPAGIGPEVILKALSSPLLKDVAHVCVIGERSLFEAAYEHLQEQVDADQTLADPNDLDF